MPMQMQPQMSHLVQTLHWRCKRINFILIGGNIIFVIMVLTDTQAEIVYIDTTVLQILQLIYLCLPRLHTAFAYRSQRRCSISTMVNDNVVYHDILEYRRIILALTNQ